MVARSEKVQRVRYTLAVAAALAVLTMGCEGDMPLRIVQRDVDSVKSEVAAVSRTSEGARMFAEERISKLEAELKGRLERSENARIALLGRVEREERSRAGLEEKFGKSEAELKGRLERSESARISLQERLERSERARAALEERLGKMDADLIFLAGDQHHVDERAAPVGTHDLVAGRGILGIARTLVCAVNPFEFVLNQIAFQ